MSQPVSMPPAPVAHACKSAAQAWLAPLVIEGAILLSVALLWRLRTPYVDLTNRVLRIQRLRARYRPAPQPASQPAGVMDRTWWSGDFFITVNFDGEQCTGVVPENAVRRIGPTPEDVPPPQRVAA